MCSTLTKSEHIDLAEECTPSMNGVGELTTSMISEGRRGTYI